MNEKTKNVQKGTEIELKKKLVDLLKYVDEEPEHDEDHIANLVIAAELAERKLQQYQENNMLMDFATSQLDQKRLQANVNH